mmetsp:Transcript_28048/g.82485  ORF Transcript_28048/g.82485 Transcript_28048/m.82485 type:complete len:565 (-) Transcript_28048:69-1763(-)
MFPSGRPADSFSDEQERDPTIFRSAAVGLPPPVHAVGGGGGARHLSTGSAKSSAEASIGSFWGLGGGSGGASPAGASGQQKKLFAVPPPPVIRQQSSISTVHAHAPLQSTASSSSPAEAAAGGSFAAASSSSWNVTSAALRPIPPYFPVERTHAVLRPQDAEREADGASDAASAAASRIVKCLDELSISAVYDDERGVCLATTGDRCRFYIRFFRIVEGEGGGVADEDQDRDLLDGDEEASCGNGDDGSILLELQRRRGPCLSFRSAAREIFRAAKGVESSSSSSSSSASRAASGVEVRPPRCPPSFSRPAFWEEKQAAAAAAPQGVRQAEREQEEEECPVAACLSNVVRLLTEEDGRIDAKVLAFESLKCVSDAGNNNERYACKAAKVLVACGRSGSAQCRDSLVKLLVGATSQQDESNAVNNSDDEDEMPGDLEARYVDEMRGLALSALANSLEAMDASTEEDEDNSEIPLDELLPALLGDVLRLSSCRPHDAAEAARCLKALLRSSFPSLSSETLKRLMDLGGKRRIQNLMEEEGEEGSAFANRRPRLAAELDAILEAFAE